MKITLLIPCYNAARFLPRIMESARAQTIPFSAIIGYDDGSTDDTAAVAHSLGLGMLAGSGNRGVSHARNRLVEAAQTEWIHFHDADDLISPDFVERLSRWCVPGTDVVSCDADWIDETTRTPLIQWRYDPGELASNPGLLLLRKPMGLNNSVIRRTAWLGIGGCNESLAMWEDADIHFRVALSGARFHHVSEVLTWSLRRSESFSHDYRRSWNCRLAALEGYAGAARRDGLRIAIAVEAEKAASELLALGDRAAARRGVALAKSLGLRIPSTGNAAFRLMRPFFPPLELLRLQRWWRARKL